MSILSRLFNWRPAADVVIFQIDPDSKKKIYASIKPPSEGDSYLEINWVIDPAKASHFRSEATAAKAFQQSHYISEPWPDILQFGRLAHLTAYK